MGRAATAIKQSDVARCVRAAKQAGAAAVEVRPNGHILIIIDAPPAGFGPMQDKTSGAVADDEDIVL